MPYRLHAVLVHEGQANAGHYWAYVYNQPRQVWLKYNDISEARGEAVHVCARILLKYTLNVDEENKVGGKLITVWFRSLRSLLGEPT